MNYYVVSPNVYNDGDNYAQKMFSKGIAAVGWDTDRQKGQQFDSIKQGDCIIVAQRVDWQWTYYYMGIVLGNEDKPSYGTLSKRLSPIISLDGIDLNFEDWTANGSNQVPSPQRIDINSNINIIENIKKIFNMQKYTDLLKSNHNLILTGAPGTGKTYLAKQIAQQMILGEVKKEMSPEEEKQFNEQCGFVQFHPSYDYTDFVEGLRPKQDAGGDVGFERKDGVFKEFCKKSLTIEACYFDLLRDISNSENFTLKQKEGKDTTALSVDDEKRIRWFERSNSTQIASNSVSLDNLKILYKKYNTFEKLNNINDINKEIRKTIDGAANTTYYWAVLNELLRRIMGKKHVFIIDEINRGEISKIFGELFFSIDPGYRGEKGKVKTQYQNLIEEDDEFYDGFYVPENVYIIGTMNDIDRSVEGMDFPFRRRFAFKEITAKDSEQMLKSEDAWGKDENGNSRKPDQVDIDIIKSKMDAINNVIWHKVKEDVKDEDKSIEGLSSAYHIGASYFLKLVNYKNADGSYDYDQLWENHLEGLLLEYMRGMADVQKKIKKLANAYGYSKMNKYE